MLIGFYVFVFILVLGVIGEESSRKERKRRYLLFTENTQFGVIATVSIPVESSKYLSVAWFYEAQYYNVANATWFEPLLGDIVPPISGREDRSIEENKDVVTRKSIYLFIETMLQRHGLPGRACILRAICENAETHFLHNGLVGDLLYFILTPSTSSSEDDLEDSFYEAEYYGLKNQCVCYYEDCPTNPLEFITLYANE
ncbi:uncharacterized protein LOC142978944 [Anticarsia gemmatalis]|uniref:uncharacterized protein LOC142978944 n=1 Tax=Anticarsia gemmatalis TaxID=129554 RepID=UPI003F775EA6